VSGPFGGAFRGRRVFVTGHTGFKGSWLCLWLEHLGASVTGYALAPPTAPALFVEADVGSGLAGHVEADVRDGERLAAALERAAPHLVLHLAAQTVVREGYRDPRETFDVNVMGTVSLLEGVRAWGRPCAVLVVTSDKCYLNVDTPGGHREDDPLGDLTPYGGSKGAQEIVARSYRASYFPPDRLEAHGVRLASARAGNVIGGGDWTADALVPDVVRAVQRGESVPLRYPDAVRPWQHVLDCLDGYLTLARSLLEGDDPAVCDAWNFGPLPGDDLPVRALVERFLLDWGKGTFHEAHGPHLPEAPALRLAIDKAREGLAWRPLWDVDTAIRETASWYRRWLERPESARDACLEQIARYELGKGNQEGL